MFGGAQDQDEHIDLEEFEVWVRSLVRADKVASPHSRSASRFMSGLDMARRYQEAEKKSKDKKGRRSSASAPAAPPSK